MSAATLGSSPLTRGKRPPIRAVGKRGGLIPAHAGKTSAASAPAGDPGAHPRSRGENMGPNLAKAWIKGSSPLTRGKREVAKVRGCDLGLIPAHAGKTQCQRAGQTLPWAHPRSRGENSLTCFSHAVWKGSSPLTRGKHFLTCAFIAQIGQILESRELCASSQSYSLRVA